MSYDPAYEFNAPQFVDFCSAMVTDEVADADNVFDVTTVGDGLKTIQHCSAHSLARCGLRDVSNTPERIASSLVPALAFKQGEANFLLTPEQGRHNVVTQCASTQGPSTRGRTPSMLPAVKKEPATELKPPVAVDIACGIVPAAPPAVREEPDSELQLTFAVGISTHSTTCKKETGRIEAVAARNSSPDARRLRPRALHLGSVTPSNNGKDPVMDCTPNASTLRECSASAAASSTSGYCSAGSQRVGCKRRASPGGPLLLEGFLRPPPKALKLTVPLTPSFAKERPKRLTGQVKTSEQREMDEIAAMRRKLEMQRKKAKNGISQLHSSAAEKDGAGAASPLKATVPQPFHFGTTRHEREATQPYQSMAELVQRFAHKTPERFHRKPLPSSGGRSLSAEVRSPALRQARQQTRQLTIAKTPDLQTMKRRRVDLHLPSAEEREEQEVEEMKMHQFKAQPVDRRIFDHVVGVKAAAQKELTEAVELHFETDERLKKRAAATAEAEEKESEQKTAMTTRSTVVSLQHIGLPFNPILPHKHTVAEPFSFEQKDKEAEMRRKQLLDQVLEEERKAREFHAQPLPNTPEALPPRRVALATQPEPFELSIDRRGAAYQAKLKQQQLEEERQKEEAAQAAMRARPPDVLHKKPFIPHKSLKPLTEAADVEFALDKRAEVWTEKDQEVKQREVEMLAAKRLKNQWEADQEKVEVARLRSATVVHHQPIKHYKPINIVPCDKPVTEPHSPRFSKRQRRN